MQARNLKALVLSALIAVNAAILPVGPMAQVDAGQKFDTAFVQAATMAPLPVPEIAAQEAPEAEIPAGLSEELREQTLEKMALRDRLHRIEGTGASQEGAMDVNQAGLALPIARGALEITPETKGGIAHVEPYVEPNESAYRNYCGPGSAVAVLTHWDADFAKTADIHQIGEEANIDPDAGAWIRDLVKPINNRLNEKAGEELNYYRYGKAQSIDDFRWMLDYNINQEGIPLITGLYTRGLPGWGDRNPGHIVAVYGYTIDADGTEWVSYVDTAPPISGYSGNTLETVTLEQFWSAVEENSAQVW